MRDAARQLDALAGHHDRRSRSREVLQELAELPRGGGVVEVTREVLEQEDRRRREIAQMLHQPQRLTRVHDHVVLPGARQAAGDRPLEEARLGAERHVLEDRPYAILLDRLEDEERMVAEDQCLDFVNAARKGQLIAPARRIPGDEVPCSVAHRSASSPQQVRPKRR